MDKLKIHSEQIADENQYAESTITTDDFNCVMLTGKGGREENQDNFGFVKAKDGSFVFCLADGLGGHAGGKTASSIAISAVLDYANMGGVNGFNFNNSLYKCFEQALVALTAKQKLDPSLSDMRTTLVVLAIKNGLAKWAHIGDVRLYHYRDTSYLRTKDDSMPQLLQSMGEIKESEIRNHPQQSKLLRSLGKNDNKLMVTLLPNCLQLQEGDFFQLASDGFWEWLTEEQVYKINKQHDDLKVATITQFNMAEQLAKKRASSYDNITVINISVKQAMFNREYSSRSRYYENKNIWRGKVHE